MWNVLLLIKEGKIMARNAYEFSVNDKTYKVYFRYRDLCESDLIDRVINTMATDDDRDGATAFKELLKLTAELLLAGLQKYHGDTFGYDTDNERKQRILEIYDLIDDYEDENADKDEKKDSATLFVDLQNELGKNGFLSQLSQTSQEIAVQQNATVIPMDHQKSRKKSGAK